MINHEGSPLLLIATNNPGKVKELQDLLNDTGIELVTPAQINLDPGCDRGWTHLR